MRIPLDCNDCVCYDCNQMVSFVIRNIEPELWRRVKAKAALEGTSLNALLLRLLTEWAGDATPNR
jgi:hypothetical protein